MKIKQHFILTFCFCLFISAVTLYAQSNQSILAYQNAEKNFLSSFNQKEVPLSELGDWRETIENSFFRVIRETDFSKADYKIIVIEQPEFIVDVSLSGVCLISTGVLDFIDDTLFNLVGSSSRKIKNIDIEREKILIPLIADSVSHLALNHRLNNFNQHVTVNGQSQTEKNFFKKGFDASYTVEQIKESDLFSVILLSSIETSDESYDSITKVLELLDNAFNKQKNDLLLQQIYNLQTNVQTKISYSARNRNLISSLTSLKKNSDLCSLSIFHLRQGSGLVDSLDGFNKIEKTYPNNLYTKRLLLETKIKQWYSSIPLDKRILKPFFAVGSCNQEIPFYKFESFTFLDDIKNEFEEYSNFIQDKYIQSDYSFFLGFSNQSADRDFAKQLAYEAATKELFSGTISCRMNYSTVILLDLIANNTSSANKQFEQCWIIADEIMNPSSKPRDPLFDISKNSNRERQALSIGFVGSTTDVVTNYGVISRFANKAVKRSDVPEVLAGNAVNGDYLLVRGIRVGDTVDTLLSKWGKPNQIIYDYYSEQWEYPQLYAKIIIRDSLIDKIELQYPSSAKIPLDIRTGDSRTSFESVYGKPFRLDYEYDVYMPQGHDVYVQYLSNKIRKIVISR